MFLLFVILPLVFVAYIAPWPVNLIAAIAVLPLVVLEVAGFILRFFGPTYYEEDMKNEENATTESKTSL